DQRLPQEAGQPGAEESEGESRRHLLRPQRDRQHRVPQRQDGACEHRDGDTPPRAVRADGDGEAHHCARQHHALDAQIQNTAALRHELAEAGEDQGRPGGHGDGQERQEPLERHTEPESAARVAARARRRRRRRSTASLASTRKRIRAWIMWAIAPGTPVVWRTKPPLRSAAKSTATRTIAQGLSPATQARMMAENPYPGEIPYWML